MVETLEHLIRQAADHPRHTRTPLYRELLRSETFLLTLDLPINQEETVRISQPEDTFPIWVDKDPELGGVWVPVFPARDAVAGYVEARNLAPTPGKEFLWMEHKPGTVFSLMEGVRCFAGIRLYLNENYSVSLPWSEVKTLAEGTVPPEGPEIYDLPVTKVILPQGSRMAFGCVNVGASGLQGKLLCLPEAGHFRVDDTRKLVKLPMNSHGDVWMACRHFLQVLRYTCGFDSKEARHYTEDLLCSLIGFRMYGEAEALCEWIIGQEGKDKVRGILQQALKRFPDDGIKKILQDIDFPH